MDGRKTDHTLIEYILALLNLLKYHETDEQKPTEIVSLLDDYSVQTAHQVIKFMDEMPGAFFIYHADDDEKIIYANQALLRLFQCDTIEEFRELTGNSFKGIVHPDDLDAVEKSIYEQIASSQFDLDYIEYRIICKDGSIRWIEDYGHFLHNENIGDIFYVFAGDATEKKESRERELQQLIDIYTKERQSINQEHLRRLKVIEGLSVNYDSILYADLDANTIFPYRMSSRTKAQFEKKFQVRPFLWYISDYIRTWVHPEDRETVTRATSPDYMREKLSDTKTYYTNYRVIKDNNIQYLQLRIVNVGKKDHISQVVLGYRRMDEEIRQEMEQNQMLEDALDNANLAISAKNTFLSNMSHDMRTPLNAIFGFTQLAKKNIDNQETIQTYLDKIETSSKQLLDLINKVLEISWTETENIRLAESECNLQSILQDIYDALSLHAAEKNLSFSLDTTKLVHRDVYSDPEKLKQLFMYLANNAVIYTEIDGSVTISVSELEHLPNDYVIYQFVVKDTGIGISESFLKRIFDPFEREKNTTISGVHGSGLGLTIAKNIAETMGGNIEIDSTLGKGSTFTVTLRLRVQNESSAASTDAQDIIAQLQNQRILLVDDNEINLEIETELLEELGFLIDTAEDGSIAVEKMKNSKPGDYLLILMDNQMPVMDGRQATKAIRRLENPALARIPIIALSADAFDSDKRKSIESGMDAHLAKPLDIPLLLETIAQTLRSR